MHDQDKSETTRARVKIYETTKPLLDAMQTELRELSKKKPEATLSKSKVSMINRLLTDLAELLKDEPNRKYLDILSDDDLPQYSDVVLIFSQFSAAMDSFYKAHSGVRNGKYQWLVSGKQHLDVDDDGEYEEGEGDDDEERDENVR
jgi:hypothetical protein